MGGRWVDICLAMRLVHSADVRVSGTWLIVSPLVLKEIEEADLVASKPQKGRGH